MALLSHYLGSFPTENIVDLLTQFNSVIFFLSTDVDLHTKKRDTYVLVRVTCLIFSS